MRTELGIKYLPVNSLFLTNPNLDLKYVKALVEGLRQGKIKAEDLEPIEVRIEYGQGNFVAEGNHRAAAFGLVNRRRVRSFTYTYNRPIPEDDITMFARGMKSI
jgi:hypothetical protein